MVTSLDWGSIQNYRRRAGGLTPMDRLPADFRQDPQDRPVEGAGGGDLVQPPTISLPKGGGVVRGIGEKFAANPVTGTGQ